MIAAATTALADLYVTPTGAGNMDGSSWANAFAGIQAAVDAVDAAVAAEPSDLVNGLPVGIRYVYSIPAEATSLDDLEPQFFRIVDVGGKTRIAFWPMRDGYEGVVVITEIFATTDLPDMADSDPARWQHRVAYDYDAYNDVWKPANGVEYPQMFFKWRVEVARAAE